MQLTMLGTGNALVTDCYNTCFILSENDRYFMVDGGGGNMLLSQLKKSGFNWMEIKEIFVTHRHMDHLMGILWMIRMICQFMKEENYEGEVNVYGHDEVISLLREMAEKLLTKKETKFFDDKLHFIIVRDGECRNIIGKEVTFFDIQSSKAKQFGFSMKMEDGSKLTCCGDEPYNECEKKYAENCKWLLLEAFCLNEQAELFHPYEKHHSTVKDACEQAEQLHAENVILYHTEDQNILRRKELYIAEGIRYYHGKLYIPEDLEKIEL